MNILRFHQINEATGYPGISKNFKRKGYYEIVVEKDGNKIEFKSDTVGGIYKDVIDWLNSNGYDFSGDNHIPKVRKIFSENDISLLKGYNQNDFYNFDEDKFILLRKINVGQVISNIKVMFDSFGVTDYTFSGFNKELTDQAEETETDIQEEPEPSTYSENPFKQAICVLGESGAGKSHTIETILENEGHEFEFIIPTAATTGLLAQFSPTKSGYVPSRLGKMIIEAAQNPDTLYTAVFDECHKSSTIEMINDELLQCISIHRNNGVRFISLDHDTAELYNVEGLEKKRGNIILPDNFGFIFISSKPRVISNNADFFNRVDIIRLKHFEEESVESSDELLSLVLDNEEKKKLVSTRND